MLTPRQIIRHARAERFGALLDAVLANGRPCPLVLRLHIERDADWTIAALALGAHRSVELAFPISFESTEVLERLLDVLRTRGIGGSVPARVRAETEACARPVSPIALAASVGALVGALREMDAAPQSEGVDDLCARMRRALDDAGAALARWHWTGSSSLETNLWGDAHEEAETLYPCDPADLMGVLWLVRDHARDIPHADIPALAAVAESMGLMHDRVLGPLVRSAI